MKTKYFSYRQASAICSDFKYLEGQLFNKDAPEEGLISKVLVAPYNTIIQWDFLRKVTKGAPQEIIIEMACQGKYEVILLADRIMNKQRQFITKALRDYLDENDIEFPMSQYAGLKREPRYNNL